MRREILKQLVDQPLHFAWAAMSAAAVFWGPLGLTLLGVLSTTAIVAREYEQWPSSRWYDPYLDWTFFAAGWTVGALVTLL